MLVKMNDGVIFMCKTSGLFYSASSCIEFMNGKWPLKTKFESKGICVAMNDEKILKTRVRSKN